MKRSRVLVAAVDLTTAIVLAGTACDADFRVSVLIRQCRYRGYQIWRRMEGLRSLGQQMSFCDFRIGLEPTGNCGT